MKIEQYTIIIISLAFGINIVWYIMKYILKKNGYLISWKWLEGRRDRNILKDIPNMLDLAKKTKKNIFLKIIYFLFPIVIIMGTLCLFILFIKS